jgi:3-oxoacyl-[acyl-carrier-protein] synthase-3
VGNHRRAKVLGTGLFVPPDIYTNHDLSKMMDTSDEWIQQRTGIKERRFAKDGIGVSDLGLLAAEKALEMADIRPQEIDMIIFATLSPDYYFPGPGVFLQDKLHCGAIPALDIRNQCSGFIYGLSIAQNFIETGRYKKILLVGAEAHSRALNFTTEGRDMAVLFGDGAGAVILGPSEGPELGLLSVAIHSDGSHRDHLKIEFPSARSWPYVTQDHISKGLHYPSMDGKHVFKHAVQKLTETVGDTLSHNNLKPDDIDLYLFHQANLRINEAVMKYLNQPIEKTYNNIMNYGNCSAASIPMLLDECVRDGRLKEGDLVMMAAFGAGFTWGSALMRW